MVFTKTGHKRMAIVGVLLVATLLSVMHHLTANDSASILNTHDNQICYSFIISGCASPPAIQSGLMRTVAIFYLKMLYHNLRYPSYFMIITNRVQYKLEAVTDSSTSSERETKGKGAEV